MRVESSSLLEDVVLYVMAYLPARAESSFTISVPFMLRAPWLFENAAKLVTDLGAKGIDMFHGFLHTIYQLHGGNEIQILCSKIRFLHEILRRVT